MIKLKINCTKIPKERLFEGKNGKYLDLVLFEKPDDYGNAGFVKIDVSKEARESGDNGEIIGNWKVIGKAVRDPATVPRSQGGSPPQRPRQPTNVPADDSSEIPF